MPPLLLKLKGLDSDLLSNSLSLHELVYVCTSARVYRAGRRDFSADTVVFFPILLRSAKSLGGSKPSNPTKKGKGTNLEFSSGVYSVYPLSLD